MSEILVTGGNGFVGRHLIGALHGRGDRVRALVLPGEDARWLEDQGAQVFRGDICLPDSLVAPMRDADKVVHLAAVMGVRLPMAAYRAINVTGTRNVCQAALAAGVTRLVHISSSSVYGLALGRPADETFPLTPFRDPYPVTKAAADLLVQRMIRDDGLPAVVLRPDQIFGPGDQRHFGRMADRLRAGKGVIVGRGDNVYPLVYVTDTVRAMLLALDHPNAAGQAFNVTTDRPLTQQQFLEAIARETGAPAPRVHLPYRAMYAAASLAECLATLTRSVFTPPVTRFGVAFFGTDSRHATGKASRELGFTAAVDLRDAVRLTAAWYRERDRPQPSGEQTASHVPEGVQ